MADRLKIASQETHQKWRFGSFPEFQKKKKGNASFVEIVTDFLFCLANNMNPSTNLNWFRLWIMRF